MPSILLTAYESAAGLGVDKGISIVQSKYEYPWTRNYNVTPDQLQLLLDEPGPSLGTIENCAKNETAQNGLRNTFIRTVNVHSEFSKSDEK
jgi:hypothetical protein